MFSQNDSGSYKRCLSAAKASMQIIREANSLSVQCMPMGLGIVWTCVAESLAVEYERLRRCNNAIQLKGIEDELHLLFTVMRDLRAVFPILSKHCLFGQRVPSSLPLLSQLSVLTKFPCSKVAH